MDNKIESFFTNAALQMNELFQAETATAAAPANATTSLLAANDSVDHTAAEDGSSVLLDDYRRFDTGNAQLDGQLIMARTAAPNAVSNAKGSGPMSVTGQYNAGDHDCFELSFDRPVTRAEAEKVLFKNGRTPDPVPPTYTVPEQALHDNRVLLGSEGVSRDGKASEWLLAMPSKPRNAYVFLKPGVEEKLVDAPGGRVPDWVPAGTRAIVDAAGIPLPGDRRFSDVRTGYPAPHEQVTCWRDKNTTFRYDGRTGVLEGFHDNAEARMGGFNEARRNYVLDHGMSVDQATAQAALDFHENFVHAVTNFVVDGYVQQVEKR